MYPYISLFGVMIPSYSIVIGIGVILALWILEKEASHRLQGDVHKEKLLYIMLFSTLLGVICGKLFFLYRNAQACTWKAFRYTPILFYESIIPTALVYILLTYMILRKKPLFMLSLLAPALVLAHAIGRIGCFLAGCYFGVQSESFLAIRFPADSIPSQYYGDVVGIHAIQLYEFLFLLVLFFILTRVIPYMYRIAVYLISYGIFRFFIEYLRGSQDWVIASFSFAQIMSIVFIFIGVALYLYTRFNKRNNDISI